MSARSSVASSAAAARNASLIAALASATVGLISRPRGAASVQPPTSGSVITACKSTAAWGRNDRGGRLAHCEPITRIRRLPVIVPIEDLCRGYPDPESTSYHFATETLQDHAQEPLDPWREKGSSLGGEKGRH